ncbi:vacuolar protein sorting-associated protein 22 1 [Cinnamomum micranthum f. kanehirae]|uniref:Vacuolar protein sorting-associated protein 22 1 n=1 Tax=Cinnamomum micranthum f. kanehirae TaxID=337451 RepID=A0A3S3QK43_9MAGN|nr:vacuolar protein sorting-associated protein 22 1 [Cinnamomum micranthum f. kanehirae]
MPRWCADHPCGNRIVARRLHDEVVRGPTLRQSHCGPKASCRGGARTNPTAIALWPEGFMPRWCADQPYGNRIMAQRLHAEAGVQRVHICLATRSHNGDLINLQELHTLLCQRRQTACRNSI